ncbi:hypothetical protein ACFL34_00585 [Candidatus Sumerlaeota bacterium]
MNWSNALRTEISRLAEEYAGQSPEPIEFYRSRAETAPVILFPGQCKDGRHGNFHPDSYENILNHEDWGERLLKPHSQKRRLPEKYREDAKELDSCNSSDALLMNVFCHPASRNNKKLAGLFGLESLKEIEFGWSPGVKKNGEGDHTEIDLRLSGTTASGSGERIVLIEAKLSESDFTNKATEVVESYDSLKTVFDTALLPKKGNSYESYQLIRNVLAAHEKKTHFFLLCDLRRPDLLQAWWKVYGAIRSRDIRSRCGFRTWQEVAAVSSPGLRDFLKDKYGICTQR